MSASEYPSYVTVANTYFYHGAPLGTVSDVEITVLASQMMRAAIIKGQAQTENHQFHLQLE